MLTGENAILLKGDGGGWDEIEISTGGVSYGCFVAYFSSVYEIFILWESKTWSKVCTIFFYF